MRAAAALLASAVLMAGCASAEQEAGECAAIVMDANRLLERAAEHAEKANPVVGRHHGHQRDRLLDKATRMIVDYPDCFRNSVVLDARRYRGYIN